MLSGLEIAPVAAFQPDPPFPKKRTASCMAFWKANVQWIWVMVLMACGASPHLPNKSASA
jgi:hypothetical protein